MLQPCRQHHGRLSLRPILPRLGINICQPRRLTTNGMQPDSADPGNHYNGSNQFRYISLFSSHSFLSPPPRLAAPPQKRVRLYHTKTSKPLMPASSIKHWLLGSSLLSSIVGNSSTVAVSNARTMSSSSYPVQKNDDEWRAILTPAQFRILRQSGTELAGSGEYNKHYPKSGVYNCAGCSAPLYKASHKFDSGCGWPAYYTNIPGAVTRKEDRSHGMSRTEINCARCGGHLGHVFKGEGFKVDPAGGDERHCVNSVSLKFVDEEK